MGKRGEKTIMKFRVLRDVEKTARKEGDKPRRGSSRRCSSELRGMYKGGEWRGHGEGVAGLGE